MSTVTFWLGIECASLISAITAAIVLLGVFLARREERENRRLAANPANVAAPAADRIRGHGAAVFNG